MEGNEWNDFLGGLIQGLGYVNQGVLDKSYKDDAKETFDTTYSTLEEQYKDLLEQNKAIQDTGTNATGLITNFRKPIPVDYQGMMKKTYLDAVSELSQNPHGKEQAGLLGDFYKSLQPPKDEIKVLDKSIVKLKPTGEVEVLYEQDEKEIRWQDPSYETRTDENGNLIFERVFPVFSKGKGAIVDYVRQPIDENTYTNETLTYLQKETIRHETLLKFDPDHYDKKGKGKSKSGSTTTSLSALKNKMNPDQWKERLQTIDKADIMGMGESNLETLIGEPTLSPEIRGLAVERLKQFYTNDPTSDLNTGDGTGINPLGNLPNISPLSLDGTNPTTPPTNTPVNPKDNPNQFSKVTPRMRQESKQKQRVDDAVRKTQQKIERQKQEKEQAEQVAKKLEFFYNKAQEILTAKGDRITYARRLKESIEKWLEDNKGAMTETVYKGAVNYINKQLGIVQKSLGFKL